MLPLDDQIVGAAILQTVTRLGIPLGMSITTVIWSSHNQTPKDPATNLDSNSLTGFQLPYVHVFIATIAFAAAAVTLAPFTRLGKVGVPFTATNTSLARTDSGLKNIHYDGPGECSTTLVYRNQPNLTTLPSSRLGNPISPSIEIQPRKSSLQATTFNNPWWRSSADDNPFRLPRISGSRASGEASGLGLDFTLDDHPKLQRTSRAAMAERVIWLVCEDCGASKRIVEPVGDPERYFYVGDSICGRDQDSGLREANSRKGMSATPPSPSSDYYQLDASVADVGVVVDRRRFALVNGPRPIECVMKTDEEFK